MNNSELIAKELGTIILIGFFLGSIPCGYIVGRLNGVDVTKGGSGNIGATNVNRLVGKSAGVLTLLLDYSKGLIATIAPSYLNTSFITQATAVCGVSAVIGHCFSPFMGGKGGRGVATSLGVFSYLTPLLSFLAVLVFLLITFLSRYVSLASLVAAWSVVLMLYTHSFGSYPKEILWSSIVIVSIVTYRHTENIKRLMAGIENKL